MDGWVVGWSSEARGGKEDRYDSHVALTKCKSAPSIPAGRTKSDYGDRLKRAAALSSSRSINPLSSLPPKTRANFTRISRTKKNCCCCCDCYTRAIVEKYLVIETDAHPWL